MSLLLDALKRAEQEKNARQPAASRPAAAAGAGLELQPIAPGAGVAGQGGAAPRPDATAAQAQAVFQAKAQEREEKGNRAGLWILVGAVAVVAIAAASYVWHTVKSLTPSQANASRPRPAPVAPPASSPSLPPTAAMGNIVPAPGSPLPNTTSTLASSAPAASAPAPAAAKSPPAPAAAPAETSADRIAREASSIAAPPALQLERSAPAGRRVPLELAGGYEALRKGDWPAARRAYETALATDPTSVDAHLGLATLAARQANRVAASDHYRRVLDLDPRNATALAGLASLADYSRPDALEAQLRSDLDRAPESAALHSTLGNLYAAQGRWSEAQSAYYEAHRLDPTSPEIAYNLAVTLDQMGQSRLAAGFYRRALEGTRGRATAFDPAAVQRRLGEIR